MSRLHELKTWPEPFVAILDGRKRFEIRRDDRGFAVGDVLNLQEWDPSAVNTSLSYLLGTEPARGDYTGRECFVTVTYLVPGGRWGMPDDLCVMGISEPEPGR